MSRQVDLTQPLSDEDREYLLSRNMQSAIEFNEAHLASEDEPYEDPTDPAAPAPFETQSQSVSDSLNGFQVQSDVTPAVIPPASEPAPAFEPPQSDDNGAPTPF